MRIIFIIIAIIGILFIVRQMLASRQSGDKKTEIPTQNTPQTPDALTECNHCGLHLPSSDAIHQGKDSFCCVEHLHAHKNHD